MPALLRGGDGRDRRTGTRADRAPRRTRSPRSRSPTTPPPRAALLRALPRAAPRRRAGDGRHIRVGLKLITKALAVNGHGELHSVRPSGLGWRRHRGARTRRAALALVDLHPGHQPPPGAGPAAAARGPLALRARRPAPAYRNVSWELRTVAPHLTRPAAVLVDDVTANRAFEDWVDRSHPAFSAVVAEEPVGVAPVIDRLTFPRMWRLAAELLQLRLLCSESHPGGNNRQHRITRSEGKRDAGRGASYWIRSRSRR